MLLAIAGFSARLNTGQKSTLPPRAPIPFAKAAIDESRFAVGRLYCLKHSADLRGRHFSYCVRIISTKTLILRAILKQE